MDRLEAMTIFLTAVDTGSLSAASRQLRIPLATVSRRVSELEAHLRTRLLNRTTRRLALTEAGERYLSRCHAILASVMEAESEASDAHAKPVGTLRVHAMSSIGQNYVVPAIAAYQEQYPAVTVDLTLSQNVPDLLEDGYDVALRVSPDALPDSNYISHKLGTAYSVLCAAPAYVSKHGLPATPEDLVRHACLIQSKTSASIVLEKDSRAVTVTLPPRLIAGPSDNLQIPVQMGLGISALPEIQVAAQLRRGELVRVLPGWDMPEFEVQIVFPERRLPPAPRTSPSPPPIQ